ncbi:TetR/AcrR family transcriptional regulator [Microbacterium lushaniae]|nr:TetR/AcrR family transcriptional regulator [Microbacterium lushaniae]
MLNTPRRQLLASAAVATLALQGSRGLTHRAVDRAAGVPDGTTSYYFRSRGDLLSAATHRLAQDDVVKIARIPAGSAEQLIDSLAFAVSAEGSHRPSHVARLELTLESTRRPELQTALRESGRAVHEALTERLVSLGISDAAAKSTALLTIMDGLLLDALSGPDARVRSSEQARSVLLLALS